MIETGRYILYNMIMKKDTLEVLLDLAFAEDLSDLGDITSEAIFKDETAEAILKSKDSGVLSGGSVFQAVFARIDGAVIVDFLKKDGENLKPGDVVGTVKGPLVSMLRGERIALNFICYLSGIATSARTFMEEAKGHGKTLILDTRKTLPGYRTLAKKAVRDGGAQNHRMGLYDMVMIKDNHVDGAGSITAAVVKVREKWGGRFRIEVECRTLGEVQEALQSSVDVILLDNMSVDQVREAIGIRDMELRDRQGGPFFEVSGNMDLEKINAYSLAGVDFISIGKMTHSVQAFDFSLILKSKNRQVIT